MPPPADQTPVPDERPAQAPLWLYGLAFTALVFGGLFFGEMAAAARRAVPEDLDNNVSAWVRTHRREWSVLTAVFRAVTMLGNFPVSAILVVLVALVLEALHRGKIGGVRRTDSFVWLAVTSTGWLLNSMLKLYFQRARPPDIDWLIVERGYSFPSGHSTFAGVFFGMLAILIARSTPERPAWSRGAGVLICLVLAVLVAASRVWLGVHYPTDVIGGLLLGTGWAIATWLIRSGWARWRLRRAARRTA